MLSEFKKKKVKKVFDFYDANGNHVLDMGDVAGIAESFATQFGWSKGGETHTKFLNAFTGIWNHLLDVADTNNDGVVSLEEFYTHYDKALSSDSTWYQFIWPFFDQIFPIIDADGDGILSKADYIKFFKSFRNSQEDAEYAFTQMDINGDNSISHLELYTMFHAFHMSEDTNHPSKIFFGKLD